MPFLRAEEETKVREWFAALERLERDVAVDVFVTPT